MYEFKNVVNFNKNREYCSNTYKGQILQGDIFYADMGKGVGSEQGGIRPVIILQNNIGNKFSPTIIVAMITSKQNKANIPTHVKISGYGLQKDSVVLLEQIRTIDKSRLIKKIGYMDNIPITEQMRNALRISIGKDYLTDDRLTKRQKEVIKTKLNNIYAIEKSLSIVTKNTTYNMLLEERELYLKGLESYCKREGLDYRDYYIDFSLYNKDIIKNVM